MWGEKMEPRILDAIQKLNNPALDWFMCFITGFGNFGVFWLLVAVVLMVIPRTRRIGGRSSSGCRCVAAVRRPISAVCADSLCIWRQGRKRFADETY